MRRHRERRPSQEMAVAEGTKLDGFAVGAGRPPALAPGARPPAPMPGVSAGAVATRRAAAAYGAMAPGAAEKMTALSRTGLRDIIPDHEAAAIAGHDEGVEEPKTPENLPAVVQTAIALSGDANVVPNWHMVRHLPGYIREPIRALGRRVFASFTDTPVEDIQTVTTLSNPETEVKALMGWISRNGIRDDQAEMDFEGTIPDYKADVQVWNVQDYTFLLVRDFAGHYVYGWPGGRGVHLDHQPPKMIR